MKKRTHNMVFRAASMLTLGLAVLGAPSAWAQSSAEDLRRMQEENASLRRQLDEMRQRAGESLAPATAPVQQTTAPAAPAPATRRTPAPVNEPELRMPGEARTQRIGDEDVVMMSPFEVDSGKDFGYLATNSMTATRIGMEIQKIPISISVISEEFLEDTNARSLTDLFRYSSAASGDTRFKMNVPANEATPQGGFTLRGFQVNTIMRNGVFRYISHNFDNVERVEMVKGPASVFFGQGYPGGVINFVTKRPVFGEVPTTLSHSFGSYDSQRVTIDHNAMLSKKVAVRFTGGWEDKGGDRDREFYKSFTATPSVAFNPFDSGKLRLILEMEYSQVNYRLNAYDWIYSDFPGWRNAARSGPFLASTIAANVGNGLAANAVQSTTTPTLAYGTYINNLRNSTGNLTLPAYTSVRRGAYYSDAKGFIRDKSFNYASRGAENDEANKVFTVTLDASPLSWLDFRYVFTADNAEQNSVGQGGAIMTPYADGIHWNAATGSTSGYYRYTKVHNLDAVFKADFLGVKNKILVGYQYSDWLQKYLGNAAVTDVNLAFLPGARNTTSNPDYAGVNKAKYDFGGVPVNQVIKDRDGAIKPVRQIYNNFDPGFEIFPDINRFFQDDRNALDGYNPILKGSYINYQGSALDDRLTVLAGFRREVRDEKYQVQDNNAPWFIYPTNEYMWQDPAKYPEDVWGHSISYQKTIPLHQTGDSWMGGLSYAVTPSLSVYGSVSKIFKFNSGNIGGFFPGDEKFIAQGLINTYKAKGLTGFPYRGQTVTTVDQFSKIIGDLKYPDDIPNEEGFNYEIGVKYSSPDQKIVGTFSLFRANRANRKEDDAVAQSNLAEPLNHSNNADFIEGVKAGIALGANTPSGYNGTTSTGRIFRVRSYGNDVRVQGLDAEVIWTPVRNFQAVINGSWLPTAEVTEDTRPVYAKPGSAGYDTLTPVQKVAADILWKSRVANIPEFRFNFFGKYTFTEGINGMARGATVGMGMRYSSETVVSQSVDWNPLNGGFQAGKYVVYDLTFGFPWEISGVKVHTNLGIYNVLDRDYTEGSFVMSPARNWLVTNTFRF